MGPIKRIRCSVCGDLPCRIKCAEAVGTAKAAGKASGAWADRLLTLLLTEGRP